MKKYISIFIVVLLTATFLIGCKSSNVDELPITPTINEEIVVSEIETSETESDIPENTENLEDEGDVEYEVEASTHYIETVYRNQAEKAHYVSGSDERPVIKN